MMKTFFARKHLRIKPSTTVLFCRKELLAAHLSKERHYVFITDTEVEALWGSALEQDLACQGFSVSLIAIPSGEQQKTRQTKERIENILLFQKRGKNTTIIALGGGVITDIAGFVAATYCRGIPLISLPTTLLAMVDASIGGKTGVNVPAAKNAIGAYHPASLVLIDISFLDTLPQEEWKNGYGEIIKYGLIASASLLKLMRDKENLERVIYQSICIKKKIVEKDPLEGGPRRMLNAGHTLAHALETLLDYKIAHGSAVAIGLAFESYLSMKSGMLTYKNYAEILDVIKNLGFSLGIPPGIGFDPLLRTMALDKKTDLASPRFVLLQTIGKVMPFKGAYCCSVSKELLKEAYDHFSG